MPEFNHEISSDVVAACQAGIAEAAEAFERAFDAKFEIAVGEAGEFDPQDEHAKLAEPGLMIVLSVKDAAALLILPEASGVIPDWYADPDATGESKLATLAQELGMVLLPEEFMPENFQAARVDNLQDAIERGQLAEKAGMLPLSLSCGDQSATLTMLWPATGASNVLESAEDEHDEQQQEGDAPVAEQTEPATPHFTGPASPLPPDDVEGRLQNLPPYSRSLLRIKVPVMVTLASTKLQVNRIVELGPGSIIQFDKSCEETLSLEVGNQEIAVGEAVKVGDKFGLRVTSMIMPDERFWVVRGQRA